MTQSMVEKCLNPMCSAKFRSLRDGKVFVKEIDACFSHGSTAHSHQLSYFWLCGSCCRTMTITTEKGKGVRVVPLRPPATGASAKSINGDEMHKSGSDQSMSAK
jgi:hypothetical protein